MTSAAPERIQKVLANAGIGSRRQIERWIRAGRINVNGQPATLGQPVTAADKVEVDGVAVAFAAKVQRAVIAYHKPVGQICTRFDAERRPTIFENLPTLKTGRWIGVGRLDLNSSGLILLTTDGVLADALMHPSTGAVREYRARVLGTLDDTMLARLRQGVDLDDGRARFTKIEPQAGRGTNRWYSCELKEGRNREVRRLFEAVGCRVNRLIRTRYGSVQLPRDLGPGDSRELSADQMRKLYRVAGLELADR